MKTQSPHETQATEFLERHGITFRAVFIRHGKHFPKDTDNRDIYECVLERKDGNSTSWAFGQSVFHSKKHIAPTAHDLLDCLIKSNPGTFDDFCSEYGYDNDSRSAERTYNSVVQEWLKVSSFFTAEEIDELQEIN
jgi:hypothetical protein